MQKNQERKEAEESSSYGSLKQFVDNLREKGSRIMFWSTALAGLFIAAQVLLAFCQHIDIFGDKDSINTLRTAINNIGGLSIALLLVVSNIWNAITNRSIRKNFKLVNVVDVSNHLLTFTIDQTGNLANMQMASVPVATQQAAIPLGGTPPGSELQSSKSEVLEVGAEENETSPHSEGVLEQAQERTGLTAADQAAELQAELARAEASDNEVDEEFAEETSETGNQPEENGASGETGEKMNDDSAEDLEDDFADDEEEATESERPKSIFGRVLRWFSNIKKGEEPQGPSFADIIEQREKEFEFWDLTGKQSGDGFNVIEITEETDLGTLDGGSAEEEAAKLKQQIDEEEAAKLKQQIDEADAANLGADQGKLGNTQEIVKTIDQSMRQTAEEESLNNDLINCEREIGGDVQGILEQVEGQQRLIDQVQQINQMAETAGSQKSPVSDKQSWESALRGLNQALEEAGFDPLGLAGYDQDSPTNVLLQALVGYVGDATDAEEILGAFQELMSQSAEQSVVRHDADTRLTLEQVCEQCGARITMLQGAPEIDYPAMVAFNLNQAVAMDDEEQKMLAIAHNLGLLLPELEAALKMAGMTLAEVSSRSDISIIWNFARQAVIDTGYRSEDVVDRCLQSKQVNVSKMRLHAVIGDEQKAVVAEFPNSFAASNINDTGSLNLFGHRGISSF